MCIKRFYANALTVCQSAVTIWLLITFMFKHNGIKLRLYAAEKNITWSKD